ncbi:DEAH-box RNA helicase PRP16 KNAG_0C06500 [Huiozyma naganishii CBS 8797]|uniref:Pre-mRNA-splicing factor ATP-dependent RNA helicase PRP16 n=1 Tax=Huiozyma naganishii (strain ATCC MYA-139 / BCRC 22969 / CBS 8797 / KCTC 17520 / NBRC 10181 / NCYC 3082 / Yp74L-3) TaxID=1071383 RepID=J7RJQ7_HUIN7|nr:hypothetical protein KNAG_0C06500 [Kazachstania naganishii CBS 8797]CCK69743.1 hypothetical protein KNAG_0C06500 [Kazachstania naganishii CBS 8797]
MPPGANRQKVSLSFDDDSGSECSSDEDQRTERQPVVFKRMGKDAAHRLKQYSAGAGTQLGDQRVAKQPSAQIAVHHSPNQDTSTGPVVSSTTKSTVYNSPITSEGATLYPLPPSKRYSPPFLADYGRHNVITMLEGRESISAFRNPQSQFSQAAKQGSNLIHRERATRHRARRNNTDSSLQSTTLGNVLGVQANPIAEKHEPPDTNSQEPTREMIQLQRESLPAYKVREELVSLVRFNQVSIVIGETGSGKTTQLAQFLHGDGISSIAITQPRRIAAMSVARRVAQEMDVALGAEVGYSIRFEDVTSSKTQIKFMTDGILLRETLLDPYLSHYDCIIIDEAHERSLNTDVLMGILKDLLTKRKDIKLIITSATINAAKFSKFFGNAPQFTIPGKTFPVDVVYAKTPVDDYVEAAVLEATRIHLGTAIESGDVLIFMTGQEDIEVTENGIKEKLLQVYSKRDAQISTFEDIKDLEVYPIYSALPPNLQNRIFHKLDPSKRKIVIATNIAETSLTIDSIRYVIDSGYSKLKVFNAKIGLDTLAVTPISCANANQRSGRAGRTGPGTAYRLYTEETYDDDMYPHTIPEIQRTNLSNTILLLKSLGVTDILQFPFIDKPPTETLLASMYELWFINALDNFGALTPLGREMSKLPLPPSLSKVLIVASQYDCSEEILTIVSMLSVPSVFHRPKEYEKESDLARAKFFVPESDHLTLLNVFSQWRQNRYSAQWCQRHFLVHRSLARAKDIREQLARIMTRNKIPISSSGSDWTIIRKCICSGFAHQAAKSSGLGKYVSLKTGLRVDVHPTSALFGLGDPPPYIIYHELLMTTKEYMICNTAVDPFWLMEYGGLLYNIKRIGSSTADSVMFPGSETGTARTAKDPLDEQIKLCETHRSNNIEQLKLDASKYEEEKKRRVEDLHKRKLQKADTSSTVGMSFKRRKPFR